MMMESRRRKRSSVLCSRAGRRRQNRDEVVRVVELRCRRETDGKSLPAVFFRTCNPVVPVMAVPYVRSSWMRIHSVMARKRGDREGRPGREGDDRRANDVLKTSEKLPGEIDVERRPNRSFALTGEKKLAASPLSFCP